MVWVKGQEAELADDLKEVALAYHQFPTPGKISVTPTKDLANQRDLALAYSPGVAAASELVAETPEEAVNMTALATVDAQAHADEAYTQPNLPPRDAV